MAGACNQLIAKLRLFLGGGGVPLLAAALSACPADCHPGLDPGGQHLATCCLVRMATKVGSPFLLHQPSMGVA